MVLVFLGSMIFCFFLSFDFFFTSQDFRYFKESFVIRRYLDDSDRSENQKMGAKNIRLENKLY